MGQTLELTEVIFMESEMTITVLVDNYGTESTLKTEHGLSLWIEAGDQHVLFDTGQTDLLLTNALTLGIDLAQTDAVVLSHGHYDHTGGLAAVLEMAPKANVFMHPEAPEAKFSCRGSIMRSIGMPDKARLALKNRHVIWTSTPAIVCPGISVTGQVPRCSPWEDVQEGFYLDPSCDRPDPLLDDQSLFIKTERGISVILGCAHAGVMNTLRYIEGLTQAKSFHTLLGGTHLLRASDAQLEQTEVALQRYQFACIMPGHCTGEDVIERFSRTFNGQYLTFAVGTRIEL